MKENILPLEKSVFKKLKVYVKIALNENNDGYKIKTKTYLVCSIIVRSARNLGMMQPAKLR